MQRADSSQISQRPRFPALDRERTAVARALALEPRLLIADEPTAELDPAARILALARMFEVAESGGALVLATHDPEVAERCDRVLDLSQPATSV